MRKRRTTVYLSAVVATAVSVSACGRDADELHALSTSRDSLVQVLDTLESGGEVAPAFGTDRVVGRWLGDDNVFALIGLFNARQISAADIELQHWGSDSVRAFAESMAREHAGLQHSADSLAATLRIVPVVPALGQQIDSTLRAQIGGLQDLRNRALDRAYIAEQVASHQLMLEYLHELSAVAEHDELAARVDSEVVRLTAHAARAQRFLVAITHADSVRADSARTADSLSAARRHRP